jgi:hypothetical protein
VGKIAEFQWLLCQAYQLSDQRNKYVSRKFTRNDVFMEVLMRTYILAIATAALFVIPTTAFSESIYVGPGGIRIGPKRPPPLLQSVRRRRTLRRIASSLHA